MKKRTQLHIINNSRRYRVTNLHNLYWRKHKYVNFISTNIFLKKMLLRMGWHNKSIKERNQMYLNELKMMVIYL